MMAEVTAFTGANLFNGTGSTQPGMTVLVADGKIAGIGRGEPPSHARAIELAGRTLMPGMTVGHFHAEFISIGPPTFSAGRSGTFIGTEEPPAILAIAAATSLRTALMSGATRIVSGGCGLDLDGQMKLAIERGMFEGPRLTACSRHVLTTGDFEDRGHWWLADEQKSESARRIGGVVFADGPDQLAKVVRQEILRGAEIIKIQPGGGHGYEIVDSYRGLSRNELDAVVRTAHERDVQVRAHVNTKRGILECLEAGVDIIDHGDELDEECIEALLKHNASFLPSLLFTKVMGTPHPGSQLDIAWGRMREMLAKANAAGVNIVPGDDFGATGMTHALGVYGRELMVYTDDMGIPACDVLRWATINGARLARAHKESGSISKGKVADMVVIDGDPTRDIGLLTDPERNLKAVMLGGRFVKNELAETVVEGSTRPPQPVFTPVMARQPITLA